MKSSSSDALVGAMEWLGGSMAKPRKANRRTNMFLSLRSLLKYTVTCLHPNSSSASSNKLMNACFELSSVTPVGIRMNKFSFHRIASHWTCCCSLEATLSERRIAPEHDSPFNSPTLVTPFNLPLATPRLPPLLPSCSSTSMQDTNAL